MKSMSRRKLSGVGQLAPQILALLEACMLSQPGVKFPSNALTLPPHSCVSETSRFTQGKSIVEVRVTIANMEHDQTFLFELECSGNECKSGH